MDKPLESLGTGKQGGTDHGERTMVWLTDSRSSAGTDEVGDRDKDADRRSSRSQGVQGIGTEKQPAGENSGGGTMTEGAVEKLWYLGVISVVTWNTGSNICSNLEYYL